MKNTGGPAFPVLHSIDGNWVKDPIDEYKGMTMRDWFAAKALPACIQFCERERWGWAAERAYEIADAMLAERNK